ncbi:VCBS repeat-containing protein [Candidatus Woesearchaeota archaeon]|nr:VCBS repeat-containing protein [Candidatus Woesearchaeota archaeon]
MRLYQKIASYALIGAASLGLFGCDNSNNQNRPQNDPAESRLEFFLDRGVIGNPNAAWGQSGTGVATGDMDGDGDLDIITATPGNMKLYENTGSNTNPQFTDRGVIGNPNADWGKSGVGVSLADMDGDGDLDIIVATPLSMKYFENTLPQKNK